MATKFDPSEIANPRKTIERRMSEQEVDEPKQSMPMDKPAMSQAEFSGYDKPKKKPMPPASMIKGYKQGGMVKRSAAHPNGKQGKHR